MRPYNHLSFALILFAFATALIAEDKNPEAQNNQITIIVNNWSSQIVMSKIAGLLFEKLGYSTAFVEKSSDEQWGTFRSGRADVQVEVWEGTMAKDYFDTRRLGAIVDAGDHEAKTREDWWYPTYMEDRCPGLPNWQALNACATLFATAKTTPLGRYLAGPWEKPERARVRALQLAFVVEDAHSADQLRQELAQAVKNRQPILLFNWTPNWVDARYDGKFIEFPLHEKECETNPAWGINPKLTWDCGNPKNGWLKKISSANLAQTKPCAFKLLRNINFDSAMLAAIAASVDVEKLTADQVAESWLMANEAKWQSWLPDDCHR